MNRGHELQLQDGAAALAAAIDAYGQAAALLRPLPLEENPSWANSLGAALMNRGALLHRAHGLARAEAAHASFDEAVATLQTFFATAAPPILSPSALRSFGLSSPWPRRNLAGSLLNRANLRLDLGRSADARDDAARAVAFVAPHERSDLVDADLSLKARRTLCDALGRLIVAGGADQEAIARAASDLVDEGLALARHWTARGAPRPRELALRLFHFGAQLYRRHQPHFLAEFITEALAAAPADAALRHLAREIADAALADPPRQRYLTVGDPDSERDLRTSRELRSLRFELDTAR